MTDPRATLTDEEKVIYDAAAAQLAFLTITRNDAGEMVCIKVPERVLWEKPPVDTPATA
jgi:hypothetical protein